jgi:prepilin-type N-terminal cleavage/methylation domain-containing protein
MDSAALFAFTKRRPPRSLNGFTLIELIIVLGVVGILFGIGAPVTVQLVRTYSLRSERDTIVTLLEWARSQSLLNADQSDHGVNISSNTYTGFVGTTYATRQQNTDLVYPRSNTVTITGPTEVVFQSLSGRSGAHSFVISNGEKQYTITINQEGSIVW